MEGAIRTLTEEEEEDHPLCATTATRLATCLESALRRGSLEGTEVADHHKETEKRTKVPMVAATTILEMRDLTPMEEASLLQLVEAVPGETLQRLIIHQSHLEDGPMLLETNLPRKLLHGEALLMLTSQLDGATRLL
jgi:hypothetical protein